jgi:DNA processing protein
MLIRSKPLTAQHGELASWLRLLATPGIGTESARRLLAAFGPPQAIFEQTLLALAQVVTVRQAQALQTEPPELPALLARTQVWLRSAGAARQLLPLGHPCYPASLLQMADPPILLYAMGRYEQLQALDSALAIVGSRNPTPQGLLNARQFGRALALDGWTVVSGLAQGIDAAAHQGALDGQEAMQHSHPLCTIAVVGTGLDQVYPKAHQALAHQISRQGLLLSEYPIGTPPLGSNFPRRNRLIAGLSRGTLVVEASLQSGSLITARQACEQGKEVMAIPGSIHASQTRGCHSLIKQGAKLVESVQDVLVELQPQRAAQPADRLRGAAAERLPLQSGCCAGEGAAVETALLRALGHDPVSLDALAARTGLDAAHLQASLLELEIDGQLGRLPGGLYLRLASA